MVSGVVALDLTQCSDLKFVAPDMQRFPCLRLAYDALRQGGLSPAALNAANEVAVAKFLQNSLRFPEIWETVEETMAAHRATAHPKLEEILEADAWAREFASELLK